MLPPAPADPPKRELVEGIVGRKPILRTGHLVTYAAILPTINARGGTAVVDNVRVKVAASRRTDNGIRPILILV